MNFDNSAWRADPPGDVRAVIERAFTPLAPTDGEGGDVETVALVVLDDVASRPNVFATTNAARARERGVRCADS
jgi:hypothetical protein